MSGTRGKGERPYLPLTVLERGQVYVCVCGRGVGKYVVSKGEVGWAVISGFGLGSRRR